MYTDTEWARMMRSWPEPQWALIMSRLKLLKLELGPDLALRQRELRDFVLKDGGYDDLADEFEVFVFGSAYLYDEFPPGVVAYLICVPKGEDDEYQLHKLFVREPFRRRGLGTKLVRMALHGSFGPVRALATSREHDAFWSKLGFGPVQWPFDDREFDRPKPSLTEVAHAVGDDGRRLSGDAS